MKKIYTLLIGLVATNTTVLTQVWNTTLDTNNVRTIINGTGFISNDFVNSKAAYEVPKGGGVHTLYELSPAWVAESSSGQLYGSIQKYNMNGALPGPVSNDYNSAWHNAFPQISLMNETIANTHATDWNQSGYTPSPFITDWPANGNPSEGTEMFIAPFEDINNNHVYDPENGDYPIIKGDRAFFTTYNYDEIPDISNSVATEYPLEVRQITYQYKTNDAINDATFVQYRIINRGDITLNNFRFGFYADFDLGGADDDYVGIDTNRNMTFVYNSDNLDENTGAINGYQANPPAFGLLVLNNNIYTSQTLSNFNNLRQVSTTAQLYNLMSGYYADGTLIEDSNGDPARRLFPGDPNIGGSESEIQLANSPGDRRVLISITPKDLGPNESICIDIALVFAQGTDNLNSVDELKSAADDVQAFYDANSPECWTPPTALAIEQNTKKESILYPNPFDNTITIENDHKMKSIDIIDISGQLVFSKKVNTNQSTLNTDNIAPGVYFVKILYNDGTTNTQKIVKK